MRQRIERGSEMHQYFAEERKTSKLTINNVKKGLKESKKERRPGRSWSGRGPRSRILGREKAVEEDWSRRSPIYILIGAWYVRCNNIKRYSRGVTKEFKEDVSGLEGGQSSEPWWTIDVKTGSRIPCWRARPAFGQGKKSGDNQYFKNKLLVQNWRKATSLL